MSVSFQGDITNNVVELNLQASPTNIGTSTVLYDGTNNGEIVDQIQGDIPDYSVTGSPYYNDSTLKGLVIGTSCTKIGSFAFYYCYQIAGTLTIPDSVTTIGQYCFAGCNLFTTLIVGQGMTNINNFAFGVGFGTSLTAYLACPKSVISSTAFTGSALTTVYAKDAVANGYTLGAGQNIGGATVTVNDWTNYPTPAP